MSVKRPLLLVVVALVATLALAACGSDEGSSSSDTPAGTTAGSTTADAAAGAFPATVEHKFGTTTVPSAPRRIVTVGLTEQDTVLALGHTPIATTEWYGEQPYAVWPWARAALGDARPEVLSNADGIEYERIAALRPDLIIGVNAGLKRDDYEKLSKLAPTVASGRGSTEYFSPWYQQVELVAAALGKPAEGRALIEQVRADYASAARAHPQFAGKTVTFSQNGFYDGMIYAYPDGLSTDFLTMLGFTINPRLTPLIQRRGEQVGVSEERIDVLDADVMVFATERASDIAALEKVPTFETLRAVADSRAVFTDGTLAGAMYFDTPLALEYVLEHLTPQLADAVAGRSPRRMVGAAG
ncbi:ABC transporter substrate-binding protein [Conexibacter sp. CPCC 206217]|uniref:ABC transporter substrate-binding protein n=1 Tax=Conexibacter sp. CPCC 206217 TaxID=3064574 RepID=UPI0027192647|nr:ABC transporter substrate-binding protein [Conexibacter sp. CPCC 206217]MDO8209717.1 ABC transporter substrate-binding protein [Conexibacter sp. CPCC 206217]